MIPRVIENDLDRWIGREDSRGRESLGRRGMAPDKKSQIGDFLKITPSKMIGGKRHYLLHRTVGDSEAVLVRGGNYNNMLAKRKLGGRGFSSFTSWSPQIVNPSYSEGGNRTGIISAWIPEHKIRFVPNLYWWPDNFQWREREVIVAPGNYNVHHLTSSNGGVGEDTIDRHVAESNRKLLASGVKGKVYEPPKPRYDEYDDD